MTIQHVTDLLLNLKFIIDCTRGLLTRLSLFKILEPLNKFGSTVAGYDAGPESNQFTTPEQRTRLTQLIDTLCSTSHYLAKSSNSVAWSATLCFVRFLIAYNHVVLPGRDISDLILCGFVTFMAISGKHRSIRTYLSMGPRIVIENMGISYRKPSQRPRLHRVLKSIDRIWGKAVNRKTPVTIDHLKKMAKALLQAAGVPSDDTAPHSLRRGGTSSAFESGCNPTCIKMQGDWASDAYLIYIWVSDRLKTQVVKTWETALR